VLRGQGLAAQTILGVGLNLERVRSAAPQSSAEELMLAVTPRGDPQPEARDQPQTESRPRTGVMKSPSVFPGVARLATRGSDR
jgi:hypothetical protein